MKLHIFIPLSLISSNFSLFSTAPCVYSPLHSNYWPGKGNDSQQQPVLPDHHLPSCPAIPSSCCVLYDPQNKWKLFADSTWGKYHFWIWLYYWKADEEFDTTAKYFLVKFDFKVQEIEAFIDLLQFRSGTAQRNSRGSDARKAILYTNKEKKLCSFL